MRLLSIVGLKDAGKTTLVVALAREFQRRKLSVATIKHASHPVDVDRDGTDSWRHLHEGQADGVLVASPSLRVLFEPRPDDTGPEALARRYFADRDLVLVEGFKKAPIPKVEVYRKAAGPAPLYQSAEHPEHWIAVASDVPLSEVRCPVLRFSDTMWLQLLASYVWEGAKQVEG